MRNPGPAPPESREEPMNRPTIPALVLALGLVITGSLVGAGFRDGRTADRFVTVKGLSEREVEADLAIWPLAIVAADNDLPNAQAQMRRRVELAMELPGPSVDGEMVRDVSRSS